MSEFPTTEEMMADLAKVDGLNWLWQTLALTLSMDVPLLTDGERKIVESKMADME